MEGALRSLAEWLAASGVKGMVTGGVAIVLLARDRFTKDVDAVVWVPEDEWPAFLAHGERFGFKPRLRDPLDLARTTGILLVVHEPSGITLDVCLGCTPFEEQALARRRSIELPGFSLPVASPEDMVVMKSVAHRPVDMEDISYLLDRHPDLNLARVRYWLRWFARILEMPEICTDFEDLLRKARRRRRRR